MTPFDFINSITYKKENLFEQPSAEKDYVPFIVNMGLSYYYDTVMPANEMNLRADIPHVMQNAFLINIITRRKRFSKWIKKSASVHDIELIKATYGVSNSKAASILSLLTEDQLNRIREIQMHGGAK